MPEPDHKLPEIDHILFDLLQKPEEFECLSSDAVRGDYAHLMPEILERFTNLQDITRQSVEEGHQDGGLLRFVRGELEDYQIVGQIHRGAQGVVYYAFNKISKRAEAVKVLCGGVVSNEAQRQRLLREIQLVAGLDHPNIVKLLSCGVLSGMPYFTMEYIHGLALNEYVLVERLSAKEIVRIFREICCALSYAHGLGIIHRDLKPGNILVGVEDVPKIIDFGLGKNLNEPNVFESAVSIPVGTLPYMSPELVTVCRADQQSDVYALGIILYELLSGGAFPFPVGNDESVTRQAIRSSQFLPLDPLSKRSCGQATNGKAMRNPLFRNTFRDPIRHSVRGS